MYNVCMDLYDKINSVLFSIGKELKIHRLPDGNLIIDIDYEKYLEEILYAFDEFLDEQEINEKNKKDS